MVFEDRSRQGLPPFDVRVCAAEVGRLRTEAGFTIEPPTDWGPQRRFHDVVPSWRDADERPPEALNSALASPMHAAHDLGLCLGAYVWPRPAAGRSPGDDALVLERTLRRCYPVRMKTDVLYVDNGQTNLGRHCCRYRLLLAPAAPSAWRRRRQPCRAVDGRGPTSTWQPGPVHRTAIARLAAGRPTGRSAVLGTAASGSGTQPGCPGRARADESSHLHTSLPPDHRNHRPSMVAQPAPGACATPVGNYGSFAGGDRGADWIRLGGVLAAAFRGDPANLAIVVPERIPRLSDVVRPTFPVPYNAVLCACSCNNDRTAAKPRASCN